MDGIEYRHGKTTIAMWPDFTKDDVEVVIHDLRPTDIHEAEALGEDADARVDTCRLIVGSTPLSYMVYYDGVPVFIFGLVCLNKHHTVLWGFGREATRQAVPAITRFVRRVWLADMARAGIRRIEARLPASCSESLQWLKSCGMRTECELPGVSVTGEPFSQLAYTWNY